MEEPWTAQWITCDSSQQRHPIFFQADHPDPGSCTRKAVYLRSGIVRSIFSGETSKVSSKIGDEYLTPYCNNYAQWIQYQTYDVTEQVSEGGMLSILLGNGWYKGRFGFSDPERKEYYGSEWKLIAEIHIAYQDGTNEVVGTDETWSVNEATCGSPTFMTANGGMIPCRLPRNAAHGSHRHRRGGLWNGCLSRSRHKCCGSRWR